MIPIDFPGSNTVYAKNQPEYLPLPARKLSGREGVIITCWKMSFRERLRVLFTGKMWLSCMTFNQNLQPVKLSTEEMGPDVTQESPGLYKQDHNESSRN